MHTLYFESDYLLPSLVTPVLGNQFIVHSYTRNHMAHIFLRKIRRGGWGALFIGV